MNEYRIYHPDSSRKGTVIDRRDTVVSTSPKLMAYLKRFMTAPDTFGRTKCELLVRFDDGAIEIHDHKNVIRTRVPA